MRKVASRVIISVGNSKLGRIPNVSLTPGASCPYGVPCARRGNCYAFKAYIAYPGARQAWIRNLELARNHRHEYFAGIAAYVRRRRPEYFRWHVAGDILDQDYVNRMVQIARENKDTQFLVYTKRHGLNYEDVPDNLVVLFSMWPGWGTPTAARPLAWMQDGTENRIPAGMYTCPGSCEACKRCWFLKPGDPGVVFHKH